MGRVIGGIAILVMVAWIVWTLVVIGGGTVPQPTQLLAFVAVVFAAALAATGNEQWAFFASAVAIAATVGQLFIALYPNVMVSSTNAAYNLTVNNASAGHYALVVMTIVAVLFFPVVLAYQGWSLWIFRKRLIVPEESGSSTAGGGAVPPAVAELPASPPPAQA